MRERYLQLDAIYPLMDALLSPLKAICALLIALFLLCYVSAVEGSISTMNVVKLLLIYIQCLMLHIHCLMLHIHCLILYIHYLILFNHHEYCITCMNVV